MKSQKSRALLLAGGEILTMCEREHTEPRVGWVGIVGNRIEMVSYEAADAERFTAQYEGVEVIDCSGRVVMPGLINTHTHVSMTLLRNYSDDMELMDWLQAIWRVEAKMEAADIELGARLGIAEMLLGGVTTFVDMYWMEDSVAKAVSDMGIRAMLTEAVLDGREELFLAAMDRLRAEAEGCSRITVGVGPHAPYTCSPATLGVARDYAKRYNLPITIHLSETESERAIIEERYGCSPLEYIDREGCLQPNTILAHCVYLNDAESQRVAEVGASVAHNAQSNMKLASGVAPIASMSAGGVRCTIATDSASSNNDLDMWEEMRTTQFLQRATTLKATVLPAYDVLRMATVEGAAAIGMAGELGVICEGALADIIVVDISKPHFRPRHSVVSSLLYCAKGGDVTTVIVDGEVRVDGSRLVGVDVDSICRAAEERVVSLIGL